MRCLGGWPVTHEHGRNPEGGGGLAGAFEVEVAFAQPSRQVVKRVSLAPGATLRDAVEASGLDADFPELRTRPLDVGVFGRRMDPETAVRPGERVEIYRPLRADPKELRRSRALRQRATGRGRAGEGRGSA